MLVTSTHEWANQTGSATARNQLRKQNDSKAVDLTNLYIWLCTSHVPNAGSVEVVLETCLRRQDIKCSLTQNVFTNSNKIHNLSNAKKRSNDQRPAACPLQESEWSFFLHDLTIKTLQNITSVSHNSQNHYKQLQWNKQTKKKKSHKHHFLFGY